MAETVVYLKVDSKFYDDRLKRATEGMKAFEQECRNSGKSLADADQKTVNYIKALGGMDTVAKTAKGQLREYTNALNDLTSSYRSMSEAEKSSDFGKAMAASIDQIKVKAAELQDIMGDTQAEIKNMASDTQVFDQIAGGVTGVVTAFQIGQGALQMFGVKSNDAVQAIAKLQGAMAVANGLTKVQAMLQKESAVMIGIATVQKKAAAAAEAIDTAAKEKNIAVTKGAAIAQKALNAVANANPFLLLASAIGAVVAALSIFSRSASKAADDQKKFAQSVGSSMGEMVSSYTILKNQWEQLTTEQEKNDWIKNNASEFSKLGVAINDVADAEKVFKDETAAMVKSFELRAKAAALQSLAEENYKKYYEKAAGKETYKGMELSQQDAAKIVFANGYSMDGLFEGEKDGKFILSEQGAALYNKTMFGDGKEKADAFAQSIQDVKKELDDLYKNNGLKNAEDTIPKDVAGQYDAQMKAEIAALDKVQMVKQGKEAEYEKQVYEIKKKWLQKTVELYAKGTAERSRAEGNLSQLDIDYQNSQIRTGKIADNEQEKADKPKDKAEEKVQKALEDYASALNIAAIRKEAGLDDEEKYKSNELAAHERLFDAYTEAYNLYSDPKYKEAFDKEAAEILALAQTVKELKDAKEASKKAEQEAAQALRQQQGLDTRILGGLTGAAKKAGWSSSDLGVDGIKTKINAGVDITEEDWTALQDKLNERLKSLGLEPIQINFETGNIEQVFDELKTQTEAFKESLDKMQSGVSAISTIGNAFNDLKGIGEDLANAFSGDMDTWDALMTVFNSGISIMQTVMGVMEAINTLTELSSALKKANTVATETEAATALTSAATEAGAEATKAGANMTTAGTAAAASSAEAGEAVAGIPIVGPILAVAAIAAVLAATFAAMSKAKSAGKFASGGIVPGNNHNDGLIANVSSGELILNRSQQDSIANQLTNSNPLGNLALSMNLKGEDIQICLDNNRMRRGR